MAKKLLLEVSGKQPTLPLREPSQHMGRSPKPKSSRTVILVVPGVLDFTFSRDEDAKAAMSGMPVCTFSSTARLLPLMRLQEKSPRQGSRGGERYR